MSCIYIFIYFVKVVSVQLADNDMDNYVLAVAKKKIALKMMKELSDIVSIAKSDDHGVYACNVISIIIFLFVL